MKRLKFITMWLLMFGVLAVFTAYTVQSLSGLGAKKAYAATIKDDAALQSANRLAAVDASTQPGFNGHEALCAIDNSQYQLLQQVLGATQTQVTIDGQLTDFVTMPKQHHINQMELKQLVGDVHCHIILQNNLFYVLFRGEVS